jgi:hypothetical protein
MRAGSVLIMLACLGLGCRARHAGSGAIIDRYARATCVAAHSAPHVQPDTRAWDDDLTLGDGAVVHVQGAQAVGGRVHVRFARDGVTRTAADAGDYIYPADVRLDAATDHLYVKASGIAVGDEPQTWLFDYDLRARRQTDKLHVNPAALPRECPDRPAAAAGAPR